MNDQKNKYHVLISKDCNEKEKLQRTSNSFENEKQEHSGEIEFLQSEENDVLKTNPTARSCKSIYRNMEGKILIFLAGFLSVNVYSLNKYVGHLPAGQFSSISLLFTCLFLLPALLYTEKNIGFHGKAKFIIFRSIFGGLAMIFKYWSAKVMDYGDSVALGSLVPVFAALTSRILWKEKLSLFTIVALLIGIAGIVLIAKPTFVFGAPNQDDVKDYSAFFPLVPVAGGLLLGVSFSFMRKVGTEVSPFFVSGVVSVTAVLEGTLFQIINGEELVMPTCYTDRLVLCLGGFGMFLMLTLLNRGLTLEKSGPAVLIRNCDVVMAYGIQILFFDSIPDFLSIVGALLVISSVVLVTLNKLIFEKFFKCEI